MTNELVITVYENANFEGQYRTLIDSEKNLHNIGFNDTISSFKVEKGCNYTNEAVNFYRDVDFKGGMLEPGYFKPGASVKNLTDYNFNDIISSINVVKNPLI